MKKLLLLSAVVVAFAACSGSGEKSDSTKTDTVMQSNPEVDKLDKETYDLEKQSEDLNKKASDILNTI
jgi:peptidoglycan hydrolase CwlO-like protein